jgi:hypothetical protein
VGDGQERPYTGELLAAVGGSLAADAGGWRAGRWRRWADRWRWRRAAGWRHVDGWRRWAAGAAMCGQPDDGGGQVGSDAQVGGGRRRVGNRATAVGRSVAARRWATAAGSRAALRRWAAVAVATAGSCESPQDKVVVVVLSLCGHDCQNESSQRANLLRFMLGRSRLL